MPDPTPTNPFEPPPIAKRYCTACGSVVMGNDAKCPLCGEAESLPTNRCAHCQTLWRSDYPYCLGCGRSHTGNYTTSGKHNGTNPQRAAANVMIVIAAPFAAFLAFFATCGFGNTGFDGGAGHFFLASLAAAATFSLVVFLTIRNRREPKPTTVEAVVPTSPKTATNPPHHPNKSLAHSREISPQAWILTAPFGIILLTCFISFFVLVTFLDNRHTSIQTAIGLAFLVALAGIVIAVVVTLRLLQRDEKPQ